MFNLGCYYADLLDVENEKKYMEMAGENGASEDLLRAAHTFKSEGDLALMFKYLKFSKRWDIVNVELHHWQTPKNLKYFIEFESVLDDKNLAFLKKCSAKLK